MSWLVIAPGLGGAMTSVVATAVVLLVLVATNVWVQVGPRRLQVVTGPLAALVLILVARMAGLTWQELGLGRQTWLAGARVGLAAAGLVAVGYAVAFAIPLTRGAFRDTRYRIGCREALYTSGVAIPLGTVLFEEVAFRGVLWGLLSRDFGILAATTVSACIFGVWHVLPAMDLARTHQSIQGHRPGGHRRRVAITVLATVAFTALAGVVFAELRARSGSLLAPICLHWATNGLGVLVAARVWAVTPGDDATPDGTPDSTPDGTPEATPDGAPDSPYRFGSVGQAAWRRVLRRRSSSRS